MATYSNPHWLLSHIRNSFISTDDTGLCEMVMASDDLPKHYMKQYQDSAGKTIRRNSARTESTSGNSGVGRRKQVQRRSMDAELAPLNRNFDTPIHECDLICYPGLDQSDDEDMDLSAQSLDIQMYPDIGAHRYRSNTAQKLEKMDIARRRAARTKCVIYDDELVEPQDSDFFTRKEVKPIICVSQQNEEEPESNNDMENNCPNSDKNVTKVWRSKLALELANSPKAIPNKYQDYAKFDGTSLTGVSTKRIRIFLSMLPDKEKNYPIKICALSSARIQEIIGLICYKATLQFPNLSLKSIDNYGLYMTEDNDDLEDFPPLDNNEPFSKFGFSHLTLAERRSTLSLNKLDDEDGQQNTSTVKEDKDNDKMRNLTGLVQSFSAMSTSTQGGYGGDLLKQTTKMDAINANRSEAGFEGQVDDLEQRLMNQDDMLESQLHRTFNVNIIDKRFFKAEVTLSISGDHVEIGQYKHTKFWSKQKAINYPIDAVAFCEIIEKRTIKATLRIWLQSAAAASASSTSSPGTVTHTDNQQNTTNNNSPIHQETNSSISNNNASNQQQHHHHHHHKTSFNLFNSHHGILNLSTSGCNSLQMQKRFKHYDFEGSLPTIEQIYKKLDCILMMRNSDLRQEFLQYRTHKFDKLTVRKSQSGKT